MSKPSLPRRLQIAEGVEMVRLTEMTCALRHEPTILGSDLQVDQAHSDSGHVWQDLFARHLAGSSLEEVEECGVHS